MFKALIVKYIDKKPYQYTNSYSLFNFHPLRVTNAIS